MLSFQHLRTGDAALYVALRREMLRDSPWSFGADPDQDRGSDIEHVRAALAQPDYAIAGAWALGDDAPGECGAAAEARAEAERRQLVGVAVVMRPTNPKRRHLADIVSVYVTPAWRGRGAGRGVMELAIRTARGWGISAIRLSVSARAPAAQRLYESLGFVEWGREPDALRLGDEVGADEIHMSLKVEAAAR